MNARRLTQAREFFDPWMNQSLGLENILDSLNNIEKANTKYPPYNIVKDETEYKLEFALAGWTMDELDIQVEKNVLQVKGNKSNDESNAQYVHKGIANRSFTQQFTLADRLVVREAKLDNGLLSIYMDVVIPEEDLPRQISINNSQQQLLEE